jgi:hypothetical protein
MRAPLITSHPQYTPQDYAYLRAKGWKNSQIAARWDQERAAGVSPCQWDSREAREKLRATTSH